MFTKTQFFVERSDYGRIFNLHIFARDDENLYEVHPVKFEKKDQTTNSKCSEPVLMLLQEETQRLMDELWRAGFRPTEGTGSAGSLAATERHLEDMRALVFKTEPKK